MVDNSPTTLICKVYLIMLVIGAGLVLSGVASGEINLRPIRTDKPPKVFAIVTMLYCYVVFVITPSALLSIIVNRCGRDSNAGVAP